MNTTNLSNLNNNNGTTYAEFNSIFIGQNNLSGSDNLALMAIGQRDETKEDYSEINAMNLRLQSSHTIRSGDDQTTIGDVYGMSLLTQMLGWNLEHEDRFENSAPVTPETSDNESENGIMNDYSDFGVCHNAANYSDLTYDRACSLGFFLQKVVWTGFTFDEGFDFYKKNIDILENKVVRSKFNKITLRYIESTVEVDTGSWLMARTIYNCEVVKLIPYFHLITNFYIDKRTDTCLYYFDNVDQEFCAMMKVADEEFEVPWRFLLIARYGSIMLDGEKHAVLNNSIEQLSRLLVGGFTIADLLPGIVYLKKKSKFLGVT